MPWPIPYALPAPKYWPIYADPTYHWPWMKLRGPPADGKPDANWPWAIYPGPPAAPYPPVPATNPGRRPFGMFSAMRSQMHDQLQSWPPFSVLKLKVPGQQIPSDQKISFMNWRVQMRDYAEYQVVKHESKEFGTNYFLRNKWLDPEKVEVKAQKTPMGERYYIRDKKWDYPGQHQKATKEPTKDLF
jgi:hypothetical protein